MFSGLRFLLKKYRIAGFHENYGCYFRNDKDFFHHEGPEELEGVI